MLIHNYKRVPDSGYWKPYSLSICMIFDATLPYIKGKDTSFIPETTV